MYKIIQGIIFILLFCQLILASSTAGSFGDNPISVKSIALGGCSVALLDISSAYKNPAGIKLVNKHAVNTMQGKLFNDTNYLNISYLQPEFTNLNFGFGFSFLNTSIGGIEETTYDNSTGAAEYTGQQLSYSASLYVFSLSQKFNDKIYYGSNLKIYQENLAGASSSGAGADIGLIYLFDEKTQWGFSGINIIKPALRWNTGSTEQINSRFSIGLSHIYNDWLQLFFDLEKVENRNIFSHLGLEYKPISLFAFRLGYDKDKITIGTGFNYNNIAIDYAYINNNDEELGTTQYISASLVFGNPKDLLPYEENSENDNNLKAAINEEQLQAALQSLEKSVTEPAEIQPLPLPKSPTASEELSVTTSVSENIIEKVEPIIDTTTSNEVSVFIEEEYKQPVHDYSIALMSARYYKNSKKIVVKVFIDNTGNQNDNITCNIKIYDSTSALKTFNPQTYILKNKETKVFYFIYVFDNGLTPGIYYLETATNSVYSTKYQKEKFINRKN